MTKLTAAVLTAILLATPIHAQETVSPQKRALLDELIKVSDLATVTQKAMSMMADQVGANLKENLSKSMPGMESLTPEQREKALALGREMGTRVVRRMFDALSKEINYNELIETVYIPVYNKYYSEDDLKGLIAFYKSPVGVKFVKVMPDVQAEATKLSQQSMSPKVMKIVGEIMSEEMARLQEDLKKLPK